MARLILAIALVLSLFPACQSSGNDGKAAASDAGAAGSGGAVSNGSGGAPGGGVIDAGGAGAGGGAPGGPEASIAESGVIDAGAAMPRDAEAETGDGKTGGGDGGQSGAIRLPPANAPFDYQLGGAYPPPAGVQIVSRDRTDKPAAGLYNICYVNGLQVQPGEEGSWDADLILRDNNGDPIIDPDWNEMLLDVSTADKRARIAAVVGGWIEQCAADGFDAVEIDNLDTYSRSGGRISQDNAVAFIALLSQAAHQKGLAIAQKNSTELLGRRAEMGTDFAVAEECSRYDECGDYIDVYGDHVLMIEYRAADFTEGCSQYGATHSIVLRDLDLVAPSDPGYVYDSC